MSSWVLLRGLARESRHWGSFPQRLRAAVADAEVIALDLPGNGRANQLRSPTRVDAMVAHVRAELQRRGVTPPHHVVALSLGAMVGVAWALAHPEELAGAVLINTSGGGLQPLHRRLRPAAWLPLLAMAAARHSPVQREAAVLRLSSRLHARDDAILAAWAGYAMTHPVRLANAARQLLAAQRFKAPRQAPAVPLLLLSGARDGLVDPACSAALAARWGAEHRQHPSAGHDLTLDDGDWVVRQITAWLAQARGP